MFAAALLYSARGVEISIYSTCKRISQKLLRNVQKFLAIIYEGLKMPPYKEVRCNMEELVLQGPDGVSDVRIVNSYPSKVGARERRGACVRRARWVRARDGGRACVNACLLFGFLLFGERHRAPVVEVLEADRAVVEAVREGGGALKVLLHVELGLLLQPLQRLRAPLDVVTVEVVSDLAHEAVERGARDAALGVEAAGAAAFA
jgi:hypothetical protein